MRLPPCNQLARVRFQRAPWHPCLLTRQIQLAFTCRVTCKSPCLLLHASTRSDVSQGGRGRCGLGCGSCAQQWPVLQPPGCQEPSERLPPGEPRLLSASGPAPGALSSHLLPLALSQLPQRSRGSCRSCSEPSAFSAVAALPQLPLSSQLCADALCVQFDFRGASGLADKWEWVFPEEEVREVRDRARLPAVTVHGS